MSPGTLMLNSFNLKGPRKALLFLALLAWLPSVVAQSAPKVTVLVPDPPGISPFWTQTIEIMKAAAEDLEISLRVAYSKSNSYSLKKDGLAALNAKDRPDYFLTGYWIATTQHHLERAEQLDIRTFIFNSGIASEERSEVGQPRGKYKLWIGQMTPDELQAGYVLADILINKAKAAGKTDNGKVHVVGLGGWGNKDEMEENRYTGLRKRINEQNDAVLGKLALTGWVQVTAYEELLDALKQFPKTGAVWSASDLMALGAIEAVEHSGKVPGQDIFIGGMDWSRAGMDAVAAGKMVATLGSHFLEGAKTLILVHDYHYGFDFAEEPGLVSQTQLRPVDTTNVEEYREKLNDLDWRQIDFKQFSKKYNRNLKDYDFSLDALLATLKP
ncbi:MAG TPA: ABC transporter substrate-binding protein [Gammaproteobacteria bacterium]